MCKAALGCLCSSIRRRPPHESGLQSDYLVHHFHKEAVRGGKVEIVAEPLVVGGRLQRLGEALGASCHWSSHSPATEAEHFASSSLQLVSDLHLVHFCQEAHLVYLTDHVEHFPMRKSLTRCFHAGACDQRAPTLEFSL